MENISQQKKYILCNISGIILFLLALWIIPHRWCERKASFWYGKNAVYQEKMARGVENCIKEKIEKEGFSTGSKKFDGEWYFGTYMMAGMAFGQLALEQPEKKEKYLGLMELCIEKVLSPDVRAFDTLSWNEDPLKTMDRGSHHAAYLGYSNLLLSFHHYLESDSKFKELNKNITEKLADSIEKSPTMLLETYPDEVYPVDNCAVIASIALYDLAEGKNKRQLIEEWIKVCRKNYIDPESGLLYQSVYRDTGEPLDAPRGSGTSLAIYFLSFMDKELSYELYMGVKKELAGKILNFSAIKEYPEWIENKRGDIDSGPIILGYGISANRFFYWRSKNSQRQRVILQPLWNQLSFRCPCRE